MKQLNQLLVKAVTALIDDGAFKDVDQTKLPDLFRLRGNQRDYGWDNSLVVRIEEALEHSLVEETSIHKNRLQSVESITLDMIKDILGLEDDKAIPLTKAIIEKTVGLLLEEKPALKETISSQRW